MLVEKNKPVLSIVTAACLAVASSAEAKDAKPLSSPLLTGTWELVAADVLHPNGERESDYGASPYGLLIIDGEGRYSLQILKAERTPFALNDKSKGTQAEYKDAVMGSSTHFGMVSVNDADNTLRFEIEGSSFRNWEGAVQTRTYELADGVLSYRVPPRPNGDIPVSVWRRK